MRNPFQRFRSASMDYSSKRPSTEPRSKLPLVLAASSLLIILVALILALLCLCSGTQPNFMEEYSLFTLNVSRIGENFKDKLDNAVMDKRSFPPVNPTPTTLITARAAFNPISDIKHGLGDATSEIAGVATAAVGDLQAEAVKAVNEAYEGIVDGLKLEDFYSIYMTTSCAGTYVSSGKNITVGGDVLPGNGTYEHINSCEKHSDLDPVQILKWVYIFGIVCIVISVVMTAWGIFNTESYKGVVICNLLITFLAFLVNALVASVTTGITVGASKLISFIGQDLGVAAYAGYKLLGLMWATAGLLGLNGVLWIVSGVVRHKAAKKVLGKY